MAKGVPTARSQRFKATQKIQDKIISTPTTYGNDAIPSPISIPDKPITQAEGAQRAFLTARMLHQALIHAAKPGTYIYDLLLLLGPYLNDCHEWFREGEDHTTAIQQQLDESNAKLISQFNVQNSEILKIQDELTVSREKQEFYRRQAEKADLVPPFRRRRLVTTDSDNALTHDQLLKQVICDSEDINTRDSEISRLQDMHFNYEAMISQLLLSTSTWLDRHEELCKLHLALRKRQEVCDSAVDHYRKQLTECKAQDHEVQAQLKQVDTQLQEASDKYDKLAAQVTQEDTIVRSIVDHGSRMFKMFGNQSAYEDSRLHTLSDQLLVTRPHLRSKTRS